MELYQSTGPAIKRSTLLRRKTGLSFTAFCDHWAGPHADIALAMPGIARYTQNRLRERLWSAGDDRRGFACDGIVELEFQSELALEKAGSSEASQSLLPEDEQRFLDAITLCRTPAGARQVWPRMVKVMVAASFPNGTDISWLEPLIHRSNSRYCSVELVHQSFNRPHLDFEANPPGFFATLWFAKEAESRAFFAQPAWRSSADKSLDKCSAWISDPKPTCATRRA